MKNKFLETALMLTAKGKSVFPCVPNQKKPATTRGFHDATRDEATLRHWASKWPNANLGLPTGEANGLVVLDVDCGGDKDGEAQLAKLLAEHGPLPETLEVRTPRGGRHIYFRHPGTKVPSRTNYPLPALDVRGDGGYVLIPPSKVGDGGYSYLTRHSPAECPAWLLKLLLERPALIPKVPADNVFRAQYRANDEHMVKDALRFIPADDYEIWTKVGMALHADFPNDIGLALWDEWSRTCPEKYNGKEIERKWPTFSNYPSGGITLGTLFELAKNHGWTPPPSHLGNYQKNGLSTAAAGPPDIWPEPQPFAGSMAPVSNWPWDALPDVLANLGREIVKTIGTSEELPGLGLLCTASIAIGNKIKVQIKSGHEQYPNIYGLALLPPGEKKTPVGKVLLPPFYRFQKTERANVQAAMDYWKAQVRIAKADIAAMEKKVAKANPAERDSLRAQIIEAERVLADKPNERVLIANDATSEALAWLMSRNHGAVGVFSSEGRKVLSIATGRYTKGQDADTALWLSGYSGDYWRNDRAGGDSFELPEPVISALIMAQPDTIQTLSASAEMRESGFLARWDYICPDSTKGDYPTESIPEEVLEEYSKTIQKLIDFTFAEVDGESVIPHIIGLTEEAFELWTQYHNELAQEARDSASFMSAPYIDYLVKLPERIARIALIFRMVRHVSEGASLERLGAEDIMAAYQVMQVMRQHGRRVFGLMGQSSYHAKAPILWEAINQRRAKLREFREKEGLGQIEAVKPRDVARHEWAGIKEVEEARFILEALETKGWVASAEIKGSKGGKHSIYYLHPNPPDKPDN